MSTLILQCLVSLLVLAFGVVSLAIGRLRATSFKTQSDAWSLTGLAYTSVGVIIVCQNTIWAPWAFVAGSGAPIYDGYLRWAPVGNHSRIFLLTAFGALLILLALTRSRPPLWSWWLVVGALLLGAITGGWIGWLEGPFVPNRHYSAIATYDTIELIAILGGLFGGFFASTMDRSLWFCLGIYAFYEALNVVWYSAMAWINVPGAWSPRPWELQLYAVVVYAMMVLFAARRLYLARQGIRVPALLESLEPKRVSLMGWNR